MIWLDSSRMWSVSSRTCAGVKPLLISRRWRVCSGSSIEMIDIGAAMRGPHALGRASSAPGGG